MIQTVFISRTAGVGLPVADIHNILIQPRGPNSALKAAAVTTVGKINGIEKKARMILLPRKLNLEKIHAPGKPTARVRIVETAACQKVNQKTFPTFASFREISASKYLNAVVKIDHNGR